MTAFFLVIAAVWVVSLVGLWWTIRRAPVLDADLLPTLTDPDPARRPHVGKR